MFWNVKYFNFNKQIIQDFNVLKNYEEWIKKQKKKCATKDEFAEVLKREMMWRFWSKCEWELIVSIDNEDNIWLSPWVGCRNIDEVKINVTNDNTFNWRDFAEKHISSQIYTNEAKIDVYDQINWNWKEFVDYIWYTRLKYERKNPKFERQKI